MTVDYTPSLKKIAFVAMPFRTKPTGLKPGDGPETVNFDDLWEQAVKPALIKLDYMPLRADEQTGSVIIQDMLSALVHADLVLADISIANGNVYYEAGIRHAARASGCVLLSADWARPLFDLKQITQVRYPLKSNTPSSEDYSHIQSILMAAIPKLSESVGPVYGLVSEVDTTETAQSQLREMTSVLYDFDTNLLAARLKADNGDKRPLRDMCSVESLPQLPRFALKELIDAVRDNLNWPTLVSIINGLPEAIRNDVHFQEQKALALSMGGELQEAIAIFKEVIKRDGKTCLRMGNLGGMYRHLSLMDSTTQQTRYATLAIQALRDGMCIDLNDYYCSHKLLIMLVQRNRYGDKEEAERVSFLLKAACQRAEEADVEDEWLYPTLLIYSFYKRDVERAREIADRVLGLPWSNWKLMGLLTNLLSLLGLSVDTDLKEKLENSEIDAESYGLLCLCREIQLLIPVSQERLVSRILPILESSGKEYHKKGTVEARKAVAGEEVVSITDGGEETSSFASANDVVVRNNTGAQELYIVEAEVFPKRYECLTPLTDEFQSYNAKGQSLAIQIDHEITTLLGVGASFFIKPVWESEQYAKEGDYFVSPLPDRKEIYRIGKPEFESTYQPSSDQ